jgi:hypothetical protein
LSILVHQTWHLQNGAYPTVANRHHESRIKNDEILSGTIQRLELDSNHRCFWGETACVEPVSSHPSIKKKPLGKPNGLKIGGKGGIAAPWLALRGRRCAPAAFADSRQTLCSGSHPSIKKKPPGKPNGLKNGGKGGIRTLGTT